MWGRGPRSLCSLLCGPTSVWAADPCFMRRCGTCINAVTCVCFLKEVGQLKERQKLPVFFRGRHPSAACGFAAGHSAPSALQRPKVPPAVFPGAQGPGPSHPQARPRRQRAGLDARLLDRSLGSEEHTWPPPPRALPKGDCHLGQNEGEMTLCEHTGPAHRMVPGQLLLQGHFSPDVFSNN